MITTSDSSAKRSGTPHQLLGVGYTPSPDPGCPARVVSVDILDSIAVVRLEVAGRSGNLAGSGVRMSDLFMLLKMPGGWKIIQKAFHWHA
jgi:Putative lumazine-binding